LFTGGPDALGFFDVLPQERVEPLRRHPARLSATAATGQQAAATPAAPAAHAAPALPAEEGELDAALFAALAVDGRTPYADLAAATGWSETTVRRRMDQLRDAGVLNFDLEADMATFGFRTSAWLWLSVPPSHLAEVGTALAKYSEVAYATATTGPANLAACVVCRDEEALYEFLTAKVGALPGVERVETAPIIRTVKQASPVAFPRP
jgi:DNA-binding Lrp family transcriptional regulator